MITRYLIELSKLHKRSHEGINIHVVDTLTYKFNVVNGIIDYLEVYDDELIARYTFVDNTFIQDLGDVKLEETYVGDKVIRIFYREYLPDKKIVTMMIPDKTIIATGDEYIDEIEKWKDDKLNIWAKFSDEGDLPVNLDHLLIFDFKPRRVESLFVDDESIIRYSDYYYDLILEKYPNSSSIRSIKLYEKGELVDEIWLSKTGSSKIKFNLPVSELLLNYSYGKMTNRNNSKSIIIVS